jgi:hypothetical protein
MTTKAYYAKTGTVVPSKNERPITWEGIEKDVAGYREGFVRVFKAHEGRPLVSKEHSDRGLMVGRQLRAPLKDKAGRQIRVTQASFAEHFGIAKATFNDWVKAADRSVEDAAKHRTKKTEAWEKSKATHDAKVAQRAEWAAADSEVRPTVGPINGRVAAPTIEIEVKQKLDEGLIYLNWVAKRELTDDQKKLVAQTIDQAVRDLQHVRAAFYKDSLDRLSPTEMKDRLIASAAKKKVSA